MGKETSTEDWVRTAQWPHLIRVLTFLRCHCKWKPDGSKMPWVCEFGFVPGCCPGEHRVPPVALSLLASEDNSVCAWHSPYCPLWDVAALGSIGSPKRWPMPMGVRNPVDYGDSILRAFSLLPPLQMLSLGSHFFLVWRMRVRKWGLARFPPNNAKHPI